MSEHDLVEAYCAGRISQVGLFRALLRGGMTVGAALALAVAAAPSAQAGGCLPGSCVVSPAVGPVRDASLMIVNVGRNTNASPNGTDNVALNTTNASNQLLDVAENLPPSGNVTP
jgi:hypothetical protein